MFNAYEYVKIVPKMILKYSNYFFALCVFFAHNQFDIYFFGFVLLVVVKFALLSWKF